MKLLLKSALTTVMAAIVATSAVGQQRSANGYVGSNRRAVTPTESAASRSIIRSDVYPLGSSTRSQLHQVSNAIPQQRLCAYWAMAPQSTAR